MGGMLVSIMLPSLCRAREPANRVKCGSNLRQIGAAIGEYAQRYAGQYPPSLAALLSTEDIGAEVMICPSSQDEKSGTTGKMGVMAELTAAEAKSPGYKHCVSYVYIGHGFTQQTVNATTVVAYEPLENHQGAGANVLFGDGHVEFVSKQDWLRIAAKTGITIATQPGR